jgi:snoRNA binding domain, fibrillarin
MNCGNLNHFNVHLSVILRLFISLFIHLPASSLIHTPCAAEGARVAAQLVGLSGGLIALSKIPACNIQVRGISQVYEGERYNAPGSI